MFGKDFGFGGGMGVRVVGGMASKSVPWWAETGDDFLVRDVYFLVDRVMAVSSGLRSCEL